MCAIVGALVALSGDDASRHSVQNYLQDIFNKSRMRGRDGFGFGVVVESWDGERGRNDVIRRAVRNAPVEARYFPAETRRGSLIGNLRAEPTTEFVASKDPSDQQPYTMRGWGIAHNGTIANDQELRTNEYPSSIDSAAIVERLNMHTMGHTKDELSRSFVRMVRELKGSYAILANHTSHPELLFIAANYRPIWYVQNRYGIFFGSSRHVFPKGDNPQMLSPYQITIVEMVYPQKVEMTTVALRPASRVRKALAVCSGGLDSVVSAVYAQKEMGCEVSLIHFMYGSRAEGPEVKAVQAVGNAMGVEVVLFPLPVYKKGDSPLLDCDSKVAGGEAGAEFAHEWVPARNLLLLSVATAYAEANGFEILILGNNLEEAGAYPDNEPEFIDRFNDLLPFAVADGKRMEVIMPVGNMMKHEIVALGHKLKAPLHLTWSCYRAGKHHCGRCGPCYMRRKAFEINHLPEVIEYVPVD